METSSRRNPANCSTMRPTSTTLQGSTTWMDTSSPCRTFLPLVTGTHRLQCRAKCWELVWLSWVKERQQLTPCPTWFPPCREDVRRLLAAYTKEKGQAGSEAAFAVYSSEWGSTPSQTTIKRTAVDIGTDYIFLAPIETAIYLHAANARLCAGSMITVFHYQRLPPS